jgi:hypothetical protein
MTLHTRRTAPHVAQKGGSERNLFQSLTHALSGGGKLVAVSVPPLRLRCQDGKYPSWDQSIDVNLEGDVLRQGSFYDRPVPGSKWRVPSRQNSPS